MRDRLADAVRLDWDAVDLRHGALGLVAIVVTLVFIAAFGQVGMTAGLAALFVIAADAPGPRRDRFTGVVMLTGGGGLVALVAVWAGPEHLWLATLLTFVVGSVATLAAGFGHTAALRGLLLALWAILALNFAGAEDSAGTFALAFVLGGVIAAVLLWTSARWISAADDTGASAARDDDDGAVAPVTSLTTVIHSPLGLFALVRGGSVALATGLGIELFPEHPIWPALTVLLILRPRVGETFEVGVLRTLGTLGGILFVEIIIRAGSDSDIVVGLAFLLAAFAMIAVKNVNYALFVLFVTAVVLFAQQLIGEDTASAATQRLLATLLGAGIAFLAIGIGSVMAGGQRAKAPACT